MTVMICHLGVRVNSQGGYAVGQPFDGAVDLNAIYGFFRPVIWAEGKIRIS